MSTKRVDGPTPNGGAYSIGTYLKSLDEPVEVEQASAGALVIAEYDADDRMIMETWGALGGHQTPNLT